MYSSNCYAFDSIICTSCLVALLQVQGAVHGGAICEAIIELLCDEPIRNWLRMAGAVVLLCVVGLHSISAPHPTAFCWVRSALLDRPAQLLLCRDHVNVDGPFDVCIRAMQMRWRPHGLRQNVVTSGLTLTCTHSAHAVR